MEQASRVLRERRLPGAAVAERETKRGTSDPTYLVYTLGKLEILELREDYKREKGGEYSLGSFHDAFLAQGLLRSRSSAARCSRDEGGGICYIGM